MSQEDASITLPETLESPSSSSASSSSDLSTLKRNVSLSRLNAKAPEFIPRSSSSSDLTRIVITPPNQPGLIHVYASPPPATAVPVPVQYVPVQYNNNSNINVNNGGGSQKQQQQHHRQYVNGGSGGFVDYQQLELSAQQPLKCLPVDSDRSRSGSAGVEETSEKVINQVEFYFSDLNLATTDHLMRFINKDPEGYVPVSVVASFKKIKALSISNSQLASILRSSAKLMVSEDGKKVRRQQPLTESDMEELQARIVVAENLPEDHCHQNLMKIFSAVGSVKMIRTCQPQPSNAGTSSAATRGPKAECSLLNKLHAFVEYESIEVAEKVVVELNDEGNWRNGLRVRLLHKRAAKPTQVRGKKAGQDGEAHRKEDGASTSEQHEPNEKHLEDSCRQSDTQSHEHAGGEQVNGKEGGQNKKKSSRVRGKGRGRPQYHNQNNNNHRGSHIGTPPSNSPVIGEQPAPVLAKQPPGPRMPDGTKGFSMGRGKPLAVGTS